MHTRMHIHRERTPEMSTETEAPQTSQGHLLAFESLHKDGIYIDMISWMKAPTPWEY